MVRCGSRVPVSRLDEFVGIALYRTCSLYGNFLGASLKSGPLFRGPFSQGLFSLAFLSADVVVNFGEKHRLLHSAKTRKDFVIQYQQLLY